jgi:D-tyrosyl-tRNA(Tyr) deacylase
MRVLIQRVSRASVEIEKKVHGRIDQGILILLGVINEDNLGDIDWLCRKLINLRIFNDENDVMNLSILDVKGDFMVVSQFTLHANSKKGNRPSYIRAASPEIAIPLYEQFVQKLRSESGLKVETGEFGADMKVELLNDGPVTIILDSKNKDL